MVWSVARVLSLILALSAIGCATTPRPIQQAGVQGDYSATIGSLETWRALESEPGLQLTGNLTCVKFVIDLRANSKVYFVSGKRYPLHDDFVKRTFGARYMNWHELWKQYVSEDRRFLLGTLVHFQDGDLWSFELQSEDNMSAKRLLALYTLLRDATFFGPKLSFRPTSQLHDERAASLHGKLPLLDEQQVFAQQRFQPVQQGVAFGILKLMKAPLDPAAIGENDIVVTDDLPADLPPAAGLITERMQAPLSHVAVLSANRGTPDMALRGALSDPAITSLAGRWVRLTVSANRYQLKETPPLELTITKPKRNIEPANLQHSALTPLCNLKRPDSNFAGAKAANLGDVCKILGSAVPAGFVVPFSYFVAHLKRHGLLEETRLTLPANAPELTDKLASLRSRIANAAVDEALLTALQDSITQLGAERVRLRSSTNAEDLKGFNGAGLYDSESVASAASRAELGQALARVWASVFNLRAYQERARYGVAHDQVAMAVLVQRSIDLGSANGVAISANPFDAERPSIYINAQERGKSVTGAHGDELPEQWLVRTFLPTREPERVSSNSTGRGPTLDRSEVLTLATYTEQLHEHFKPAFDSHANSVDVEWVLAADGTLYIVQVRPYLVRYPEGPRSR